MTRKISLQRLTDDDDLDDSGDELERELMKDRARCIYLGAHVIVFILKLYIVNVLADQK